MATAEVEEGRAMKLTQAYEEMAPEKRPQDQHLDGIGLRFKTLDHGCEYPDTMPQAIKLINAERRSCIYVPIAQNAKVVDSQGFVFDPEDEDANSARHRHRQGDRRTAAKRGRTFLEMRGVRWLFRHLRSRRSARSRGTPAHPVEDQVQ